MPYRYFICDVFTDRRFGGNPLAVLPDAAGLSAARMQAIAREFNFSETTFVTESASCTRKLRIFTPVKELPFAGHPNVGTAFALAQDGAFGEIGAGIGVTFEEAAGIVPIRVLRRDDARLWCELQAPQGLTLGASADIASVAAAVSLSEAEIVTSTHPPRLAGVGLPFLIVEVAGRGALERARANLDALARLQFDGAVPHVHLYTRSDDDFDLRARMFAPLDGVPEDPATGSANCALAALLAHYDESGSPDLAWRIAQGVEMGRPSRLDARTRREGEAITTAIGGYSVLVSEGTLHVD